MCLSSTNGILKGAVMWRGSSIIAGVLAFGILAEAAPAWAQQGGPPPAPPVQTANPIARKITQFDEYTGRFEAIEQVEVRARVSGFIDHIHFRDGQMVKKGDLLFSIDPRPYQLAAEAARAEVARARAQVLLGENEVERAEGLTRNQTITARDLDQRRANLSSAKAGQAAAEANLKAAELNLDWSQVRAPIDGRISDKRVDVGNLIAGGQAGATLLTTIVKLDPIHFVFDASESDYIRYARLGASGERPSSRTTSNPVAVRLADEKAWTRTGRMDFIDNAINARSGTIRGRAIFDNKDMFLAPGTFGRLRLYGGEIDALLIPDTVVVSDQTRKIVLVVGPDNKLQPRPVELGAIVDGLRVIRAGLKPDDRVMLTGHANPMIRPGVTVTPVPGEIKPAPTN
jgi:RND family efflux transporter MFP subunit